MAVSIAQTTCSVCRDPFAARPGDCCGRCNRMVCRACSHVRGRSHDSVLCVQCAGTQKVEVGLRATSLYRSWRRMLAG